MSELVRKIKILTDMQVRLVEVNNDLNERVKALESEGGDG